MNYTESERVDIAWKEYDKNLSEGDLVTISDGAKTIGTVSQIIDDEVTGVKTIVIEEPSGNVTVLFQGSKGPGEDGWVEDWGKADAPMAAQILYNNRNDDPSDDLTFTPDQLKVSALILRSVMLQYPEARVSLYAHSLGSMNVQYALANLEYSQLSRIDGAWIYNGPNIYSTLTDTEKKKIDSIKTRITNYIDLKDIIGLGYPKSGSKGASGIVKRIRSDVATKTMKDRFSKYQLDFNDPFLFPKLGGTMLLAWFEDQHMWGGYRWDAKGNVILSKKDQKIYEYEMKYFSAQSETILDMAEFKSLKSKWYNTGNTIDSDEEIFLDAGQSYIVGTAMAEAAGVGLDEMTSLKRQSDSDADKVWSEIDFSIYSHLPYWEVEEIFASHGVTHEKIVSGFHEYTEKKVKKVEALSQTFDTLKTTLDQVIEEKIALDNQIAREFKEWKNTLEMN